MTITATTLASACGASDQSINVTSATGITAPNFTAGSGITLLVLDQEFMVAIGPPVGTIIPVLRGQYGTAAVAHVVNSQVQIGLPGDFSTFGEFLKASLTVSQTEAQVNWPAVFLAGSTDAIPAGVAGFYVIKTAGVDACTLGAPTLAQEGNIISIWSDTANAHTVTAPSAIFAVGALKTVATFPAARGAGIMLRACNLFYHLISSSGTGTNSGPVVWT